MRQKECIHESDDVSWWNENDKYCLYLNTEEKGNKSFETKIISGFVLYIYNAYGKG